MLLATSAQPASADPPALREEVAALESVLIGFPGVSLGGILHEKQVNLR